MASFGGLNGASKGKDLPLSSSRSSINSAMGTKLENAKILSFEHLKVITDNFSPGRVIGQGGYGTVYKGVLADGKTIAVKVLKPTGADNDQFKHEFETLMKLKHHNIVQLVGYCYETQHKSTLHEGGTIFVENIYRALCFEYMQNGSLKRHISVECDGLEWHTRYKIIKGACEGLKYLHEEFQQPLYHLDLKPDNILLDENMVPKLADFGSAKLFDEELTMVITHPVAATPGYIPPEYFSDRVVSKKFDIFSLGVVMTKIIAGPKAISLIVDMDYQAFLDQVHKNWRNRLQETWHNSKPVEAYCGQVNICIAIALSCMVNDKNKRPSILDIIDKLNETETVIKELDPRWTRQHITMGDQSKKLATPLRKKSEKAMETTSVPIRVLQDITDNFSEEQLIGQWSHGRVYRGKLENGEEIAVKLLCAPHATTDEQFQHESDNLMTLSHPNIVQFVGYCCETHHHHVVSQGKTGFVETENRALCFEYMRMGSLQRHLSDESCGLDWQSRYEIIKGTCGGLKYLHEGLKKPICHLELKPDNILLDENMMPKLDIGLTKLVISAEKTMDTFSPLRTMYGYMPPEYLHTGLITKKFDIFSLGVVMIEILAGPSGSARSSEMPYQEFVDQVHENWRNRMEATCSPSQTLGAYCEQVSICTKIALSCVEDDRRKRPSIGDIIDTLDATESMIEKVLDISDRGAVLAGRDGREHAPNQV